jgi:aspartyl-tRNA(Asn)/glutamyl-tRNA(Gln) amidotransferase subunit A
MYLADLFTVQANLAGNPAISIPSGTSQSGLPIGVQLMTSRKSENDLYDLSELIQQLF